MKVLIIEDDRNLLEVFTQIISAMGHIVYAADDLDLATKFLSQYSPDLIFLDLLLNGNIGTPFIEVTREMMKERPPRIVVISAMNKAEHVAESNGVEFLMKPFDLQSIEKFLK